MLSERVDTIFPAIENFVVMIIKAVAIRTAGKIKTVEVNLRGILNQVHWGFKDNLDKAIWRKGSELKMLMWWIEFCWQNDDWQLIVNLENWWNINWLHKLISWIKYN